MTDVPRSTVIILLTITLFVSVLGTIAVLSSTKIMPKVTYMVPNNPPTPPMGVNDYGSSEATGLVSMEVVYPTATPETGTRNKVN